MTRWKAAIVLLNLFAAAFYVVVGWLSGYLGHPWANVFQSPDSQQYRDVGDWIFQGRSMPEASIVRPFLFPLLLGLAGHVGGAVGVWLLNVVLWFAALNIGGAAAARLARSSWAAVVVFIAIATNVSLILLTFQGLTEITTIALLCVWMYGLSRSTLLPTPSEVAWTLLPVALLVVVKPEFELLLGLMVIVLAVKIVRAPSSGAAVTLAACLIPVAIQVGVMERFNHYLGVSAIGDITLRKYFLARLEIAIGSAANMAAARTLTIGLGNFEIARLVLDHIGEAIFVFAQTLKDNLLAGTNFIAVNRLLNRVVELTNLVYLAVLVVLIPLAGAALWRGRDLRLALLCAAILNIMVAGGLSFDQGDRLTVVALPLWATVLVMASKELFTRRAAASSTFGLKNA
jgi:hypothetical protein